MADNNTMALLRERLQAAMPGRLVTRSASDFAQRPQPERRKGVVTLAATGITDLLAPDAFFDLAGKLGIALLAEFELEEKASGEQVESTEWGLLEELRAFVRAPGAGLCPLAIVSVEFSRQEAVPTGWLFAVLQYAELD